jgi:transcriptional regulator with XRE-family HTH domain
MTRYYYLRTLRQRRQLTQVELERLTRRGGSEVAQNTISKLESNPHARPVFSTVVALARALRVRPEQLRFGPDPRVERIRAQELAS